MRLAFWPMKLLFVPKSRLSPFFSESQGIGIEHAGLPQMSQFGIVPDVLQSSKRKDVLFCRNISRAQRHLIKPPGNQSQPEGLVDEPRLVPVMRSFPNLLRWWFASLDYCSCWMLTYSSAIRTSEVWVEIVTVCDIKNVIPIFIVYRRL